MSSAGTCGTGQSPDYFLTAPPSASWGTGSLLAMRRLLTPRWLLIHLLVAAVVTAMLALTWWQVGRARGGNMLSIGYSLEWPVFAAFVIFVWIRAMRAPRSWDLAPRED